MSASTNAGSVNPHQYPRAGEVFLDHVGIFTDDADAGGKALERLGFRLTPYRVHTGALRPGEPSAPLGTANRSAMFRVGYVEMLCPVGHTPLATQLRSCLARYAGLHLVAFTGTDADEHHAALVADGLNPAPIARAERTQATPEGEIAIRARIVRLAPEAWPEGRVQMVFPQMSADAVWHADLVKHANGADRLGDVLIVVGDPCRRAERFARFARRPFRASGDRFVVETDRGRLHLVAPDRLHRYVPGAGIPDVPFMAAVAIGSRDLAVTRAWMHGQGLGFTELAGTFQAVAPQGLGATFVFHDRDDDDVFGHLDRTGIGS